MPKASANKGKKPNVAFQEGGNRWREWQAKTVKELGKQHPNKPYGEIRKLAGLIWKHTREQTHPENPKAIKESELYSSKATYASGYKPSYMRDKEEQDHYASLARNNHNNSKKKAKEGEKEHKKEKRTAFEF